MVFLMVGREELDRRLLARHDHFFPEKLLDSQLAALEPPAPDEGIMTVPEAGDAEQTADKVMAAVWPSGEPAE
jgi:gluconate kinase